MVIGRGKATRRRPNRWVHEAASPGREQRRVPPSPHAVVAIRSLRCNSLAAHLFAPARAQTHVAPVHARVDRFLVEARQVVREACTTRKSGAAAADKRCARCSRGGYRSTKHPQECARMAAGPFLFILLRSSLHHTPAAMVAWARRSTKHRGVPARVHTHTQLRDSGAVDSPSVSSIRSSA